MSREDGVGHDAAASEPVLLEQICAASVQGHGALFPESPPPMARLGRSRAARAPALKGSLCCDDEGFSLHAQVCVPAGQRERLEHLCRYVARPAIASERLALSPGGRVIYGLRRHWRDGTSAVSFDPLTFIERLAALVPRPRAHQHTYHGVLAPAAAYRDLIVPGPRSPSAASNASSTCASALNSTTPSESSAQRATWAELLKRVFAVRRARMPKLRLKAQADRPHQRRSRRPQDP